MNTQPCANVRACTVASTSILLALAAATALGASHAVLPPGDPQLAGLKPKPPHTVSTSVQKALDKAADGDTVTLIKPAVHSDRAGRYIENVTIRTPNVRLGGDFGVILQGTIRVEAPGVTIRFLTLIGDEACVVLGPGARDCDIYLCRLAIRRETGVALDVVGPDAGGLRLSNCTVYTAGGKDPDTEHRGFKLNWKPMPRAAVGVRIHGQPGNDGAYVHHTRIAAYETGLRIGDEGNEDLPLKAHIWKNQITANTKGITIFGGDCLVEDNQVLRSTGTGIVAIGPGNRLLRNHVLDSAGVGMRLSGGRAVNNVLSGNRGGAIAAGGGGAQIVHTTIVRNDGIVLAVDESAGAKVLFVNNLVDHDGALFETPEGLERHHNVYVNHNVPAELGDGSRTGPLRFEDVPRRVYRPAPHSIAIDAAIVMAPVNRDVSNSGRVIGALPDAGAHEVGPPGAAGRQWWVATDGDDEEGTGSDERPFRSVTRASRDAGPGDHIYLKPGDYEQDEQITCAGAPDHPVRISPAPGIPFARNLVTRFVPKDPIEMAPAPHGRVIVHKSAWKLQNATHVHIEGIEFRDTPHGVIRLGDRAAHNAVRRCVFLRCPTNEPGTARYGAGIVASGLEAGDLLIEDNVFDARWAVNNHLRETDVINPGEGNWCKRWVFRRNKVAGYQKLQLGIGLPTGYVPTYHRVEDNEFFNCNEAVHIKTSDNIFRGNHIHHMSSGYLRLTTGMVNRSGFRNIYENNLVQGCSYAGMFVMAANNIVRNNVIEGCDTGVIVSYREFGAQPAEHTRILHNTIVDCARGIHVDPRASAMVHNNIVYRSPQRYQKPAILPGIVADNSGIYPREKSDWTLFGRIRYTKTAVLRSDYNVYFNAEPAYVRNFEGGHYDVYGDPMFVDPANGDYRLQPGSPARCAGWSLGLGHDLLGQTRPLDQPDCGAYQGRCEASTRMGELEIP